MANTAIIRDAYGVPVLIPLDVAHHSGMISPTVPI